METLRERIIGLLLKEGRPLTARQIAALLELDERNGEGMVYSNISHVARTIRRRYGKKLNMIPPTCANCGFIFSRMKASRCPRCKSQRITPAKFFVR